MKRSRPIFFCLSHLSLAAVCLLPIAGYCRSLNDARDISDTALQSIAVSPRRSSIGVGATQQFKAIGTYANGRRRDITSRAAWSSSATSVATISSSGLATGVAAGQTKITAELDSIVGSAQLKVTHDLVSIAVTPADATIIVGNEQQYTSIGTYSDGTTKDITSKVTWDSSAPGIVSINGKGLATGVVGGVKPGDPPGASTIAATLGSVNGSTTLTVTDNLTAIVVNPGSVALQEVGMEQALTAVGSYQDLSQADITSSAAWSTGNACVATIIADGDGAGTVTAAGLGTVSVTAAESGIIGTATATVGTPPAPFGVIPASFFGMTIGDDKYVPYPYPPDTVPIGAIGHPTAFAWSTIEPDGPDKEGKHHYDFTFYDKYADWSAEHGVPFMVTFGWTPYWAVSQAWKDSNDCHPVPNWCSAPPQNNSDWIAFITAVVNHYDGNYHDGIYHPRIQYYELWNEANDLESWAGTQQGMAQLANLAYQIIHPTGSLLGAPSVTGFVSGESGAAAWLGTYLSMDKQNGGWGGAQYADGGSFHGYLAPTDFPDSYPFPEECSASGYGDIVTRALTFRNVLDTHGLAGKPMFDSEGSWGKANIADSDQQVAWLARWYLLQAGSQVVQSAYWFAWGQSTPGKPGDENQWGLISDDSGVNPTAAGIAYGQVYDWLVGSTVSPCSSTEDANNLGNYVWTCSVVSSAGQQELAVWYYSPDETSVMSYTPDSKYSHYRDLKGDTYTVSPPITITAKPILLTP